MPSDSVFEIGFVLAGAVSAGCYSAGAMDFIIEALDDYDAEKDKPTWDGPRHDVRVPVLAGASAGGMTAGMAALHMFRGFEHVWPGRPVPAKSRNRLYASWVTDISIARLLETIDLDGNADGLKSALCSTVLDEILRDAFSIEGPVVTRRWLGRGGDRSLCVMVTLTNLRGVPYSFDLFGSGAIDHFGMFNHADVAAFRLGAGDPPSGERWLDVEQSGTAAWDLFKAAVLGTGAFPIGLAPRFVRRMAADYQTGGTVGFDDPKTGLFTIIRPDGRFPVDGPFDYWAVDGGTIDNEPLEQARRCLTGGSVDEPDGGKADKAVIMIAPFPTFTALERDTVDGTLLSVLPRLVSSILDQARFKPEELAKAQDPSDFSRFMIAPVRTMADGSVPKYPIASGALGHFGGFLHESFRRHDYLLGRRNAQAFLRWHFGLPKSHPIFGGRTYAPSWLVREAGAQAGTLAPGEDQTLDRKRFALRKDGRETEIGYPIIPLTRRMQTPIEIPPAERPVPSRDMLEPLVPLIQGRVEKVVERLVDVDLQSAHGFGSAGWLVRQGAKLYATDLIDRKVKGVIGDALDDLSRSFP